MKPPPRPRILSGATYEYMTTCGKVYITVNSLYGTPVEVFVSMGKAGGCAAATLESIARLVSKALRSGLDLTSTIRTMDSISCRGSVIDRGVTVQSCPDAIAKALNEESKTAKATWEVVEQLRQEPTSGKTEDTDKDGDKDKDKDGDKDKSRSGAKQR